VLPKKRRKWKNSQNGRKYCKLFIWQGTVTSIYMEPLQFSNLKKPWCFNYFGSKEPLKTRRVTSRVHGSHIGNLYMKCLSQSYASSKSWIQYLKLGHTDSQSNVFSIAPWHDTDMKYNEHSLKTK
jgi:hypothetical protein